jgi:hypothetical protein
MLAPSMPTKQMGMEGKEPLLRLYGAREVAAGIGILMSDNPAPWVWGRVAGDVLDLATLASALDEHNTRRGNAAIALAAVVGITALDGVTARALTNGADGKGRPVRDFQRPPGPAAPAGRNARRGEKGFHSARRHARSGGAAAVHEPIGHGAHAGGAFAGLMCRGGTLPAAHCRTGEFFL